MTAPYTYVDFRRPLPGSAFGDPAGAVFDRPVPGRCSGRIELTVTTLSPLFIGSADAGTGTAVRIDDCFAIPGSALKGMLRAYLAAMTGSSLGPQNDTVIWYRNPIGTGNATLTALKKLYEQRRRAAAAPGAHRIGLLVRDPVHGYAVLECPPLRLPRPGRDTGFYSAIPKVTWRILGQDLPVRRDITDPELGKRNDRRIWVVWAAVHTTSTTAKTRSSSVRKVVFAVGDTADEARARAESRKRRDRAHEAVPTTCVDTEFISFLDDKGLFQHDADTDDPLPVQMILHATGLTAPNDQDPAGAAQRETTDTQRNAYLFPIPDTDTAEWIGRTGEEQRRDCTRLPVSDRSAIQALTDPDQQQLTDYQNALPDLAALLTGDGVPVFFDTDEPDPNAGGQPSVIRLGRGGGFRIKARRSFRDTIPAQFLDAGFDAQAPDLVQALFGDSNDEHARKGRVSLGAALAPPAARTLSRQDRIVLLGPKIQAWYRRLQQPEHPVTTAPRTYDHDEARYRGREMYLHRWPDVRTGSDEKMWADIADHHRVPRGVDNKVGRTITPVAPRTRFTGSLRFTNLTAAELGALILVLTLGNDLESNHGANENPHYAHLLGGGRPLGLGSVHLAPTVYLDNQDRYTTWGNHWGHLWTKLDVADLQGFVEAFKAALRLAEPDQTQWTTGPTGHRQLRSIAQVFTIAQWRKRLPPTETADMSRDEHQLRLIPKPLPDLFP